MDIKITAKSFEHRGVVYTSIDGKRWFKYLGTLFKDNPEILAALVLLRCKSDNNDLTSSALNLMTEVYDDGEFDGDMFDN